LIAYELLLAFYSNYGDILYHFWSKIAIFLYSAYIRESTSEYCHIWYGKTRMVVYQTMIKVPQYVYLFRCDTQE